MRARPFSGVDSEPVDWFWSSRLAFGRPALLEGDPGLGKSLVALDLCARLSTGRPFPDGHPCPGPAASVVINAEDSATDTIRPRLHALGADLDRVFVLHPEAADPDGPLRLPSQTAALERALAETQARLVVLDPVTAVLDPGVNVMSEPSVRHALAALSGLLARYRCALLLIRHLNKKGGHRSLYRGGGSIAFVAACRCAWLIARDPLAAERCVLAQVKNNLAPPQPSLAFAIKAAAAAPPQVVWAGPSPFTADQLLDATRRAPARIPARDLARDFLQEFLTPDTRTSREIWEAAQKRHLSKRTLHRARLDLNIRSLHVWQDGQRLVYWLLPGQKPPASVPPEQAPPDLEPWLARLREKYPPLTPIDDL